MGEKIWFIGDTHFNHRNIITYCNRPFATVSEMNKALIDNWNKVVRKEDKVIMNGDFALSGKDKIIEIGQQLNGRKTLILGNHDGASLKTYYDAGFEMVSKYPIVVEEFFIVSHMPQYVQENGVYVNIFAHVHNSPAFKDVSTRSFCTSAERINYTPILFEDIKAQIQAVCDKEEEE
jgi:calcineurin-like phosphoesterase family protein